MKNQNDEMIASAEAAYDRAAAAGLVRISPRTTSKRYTAADFKNSDAAAPAPAAGPTATHTVNSGSGGVILEIHLPKS